MRRIIELEIPGVELISIESPRAFLRGTMPELDAVVYSAEGGSAWTLLYPAYTAVIPQPGNLMLSMAYPLPKGEPQWENFVSEWIQIKQKEGKLLTQRRRDQPQKTQRDLKL